MMVGTSVGMLNARAKAFRETQSVSTTSATSATQARQTQKPHDVIFNTQFTTAGKRLLTKIKKNRAMQVSRRSQGFQMGLEKQTVLIDPLTGGHYRVMLVDPDMQRREHLADTLEQRFEMFVAPSNERAFALLGLFKLNFVLLRLGIGNDQTAATSPALTFLQEMKRTFFRMPVAALVDSSFHTDHEVQKLLARALQQGGVCGYFVEGLAPEKMAKRIAKLLRTFTVAQNELVRCRGTETHLSTEDQATKHVQSPDPSSQLQLHGKHQISKARSALTSVADGLMRLRVGEKPTISPNPNSVSSDRANMVLELDLKQRKQCIRQREMLQATLASAPHSVLGIAIDPSLQSSGSPAAPLATSTIPLTSSFISVDDKIKAVQTSMPSTTKANLRTQNLQAQIGRPPCERLHIAEPSYAVPQEPLLNHCVIIHPCPQSRDPVVDRAFMLFCEQRLDDSLLHCDRALRMPNLTLEKTVRILKGALHDTRGEHARAEAEFIRCIQLDPSMHEAYFNLSVAQLKQGKDAQALKALTQALTLDPQNDKYLQNRGLMYRRMGFFVQAQSEYSKRGVKLGNLPTALGVNSSLTANTRNISCKQSTGSGSGSTALLSRNLQQTPGDNLSQCEMEDGLFAHLFGKPTLDKLALVCPAANRSHNMISAIVAKLQTYLLFQDLSREVLFKVAQALDYDVVACGKSFELGETHSQNFYVVLEGKLSVRKQVGRTDVQSSVAAHRLEAGSVFGCVGLTISPQASLIADNYAEIGILWPFDYAATIQTVISQTNQEVFAFLKQLRSFRLLSTSELGHIVGILKRKRFRRGDVILEQNEQPQHLIVLRKGSCAVYQDFDCPPLSRQRVSYEDQDHDDNSSDDSDDDVNGDYNVRNGTKKAYQRAFHGDEGFGIGPSPFHHLIAKPDWPLGFQTCTRARNYRRGRRDGLLLNQNPPVALPQQEVSPFALSMPMRHLKEKLAPRKKKALVLRCSAPAMFGESSILYPKHAASRCSVLADTMVEVLLIEHIQLQEMDLQPHVISELWDASPKYQSEKDVAQTQVDVAAWKEYRSLRLLELSKLNGRA